MSDITELLLDSAADLLAARGFHGLRMIEVAGHAGVSRQTVYNEFGNKEGLVQAVAVHKTEEYLTGIAARLQENPDPWEAMRSAFRFTFEQTEKDRLVSAVLTGQNAEDLLPFITIRGHPILFHATEVVEQHLSRHFPGRHVRFTAETTVRLALSHLLMPSGDLDGAMDAVVRVARVTMDA
ncbi:TetR/AcrR family transcriptional regulator [Lentzea albidocapillata]|uniref:Transcriptional regulator, TetR family n=2 Tax=Lentzea albidocapillata TaxID=40571 RepID=A0A1W2FKE3_9PSEU|nr:TetR family transcriptional regulator [Lentzea albidocapillata]SDN29326.1 transcriptional regulator, TetR family [Lentzea albidocapillata subsp. violacea]SMD22447.1 transcriptional regulator, TetR family [Lentzea albidocapillata]